MGDIPQGEQPTVDVSDKVASALRNAAQQDMAAEQQEAQAPPQPPVEPGPAPVEPPGEQPQPDAADSFMNLDPATLPPELQAQYRNMQGAFTRAQQESAPFRQLAEQYGLEPQQMAEALDFVGRLQSDPAYTQQVYTSLGEYLQQLGLREPQAAPAPQDNEFADMGEFDPGGEVPDAPARATGSALEMRLAAVEQVLQTQEQQLYMRDLAQQIKQQEFAVREAHPDWSDKHIQRVYELAPSFEGDLTKAAGAFAEMRTELLSEYLEGKAQVPVNGSGGGMAVTGTEAPTPAASLRQASERVEERLMRELGE